MSRNEFYGEDQLDISTERADDESGMVTMTITANGDVITINAGRFQEDASALADELEKAAQEVRSIAGDWEDRPDDEDGWVLADRDGYFAKLSNEQAGPFPSQDIATYELARMMADSGYFPNAWRQDERGNYDAIHDAVRAFHDEGGDKLLPLPDVRYADGAEVTVSGDGSGYVVRDYGNLGVVVEHYGDISVHEHDELATYTDEDEEN